MCQNQSGSAGLPALPDVHRRKIVQSGYLKQSDFPTLDLSRMHTDTA